MNSLTLYKHAMLLIFGTLTIISYNHLSFQNNKNFQYFNNLDLLQVYQKTKKIAKAKQLRKIVYIGITSQKIYQDMKHSILGWIGTGVMGYSMCRHLLSAGHIVNIYTRTKSKADALLTEFPNNAKWMSPSQIAKNSNIIFMMLGYPHDVEDMCLKQNGLLSNMNKGSYLIDHTTSNPQLAERIGKRALQCSIKSIDAPVTGGDVGARNGKLVTMCGGQPTAIEQIKPLLQTYSKCVENFGTFGRGQHAKLTNQIILAGNMIGMAEGLIYASKMKMDLHQIISTISLGAASSTSLSVLGTRAVNNDYNPGFYVEHYIKDMEIALEQARRANLKLPNLQLVRNLYVELKKQGGGQLGTQALIKVLERMNNHKIN